MSGDQTDASQVNILVVDDVRVNLQFLVDILTKRGYKVRPASSGRMALLAAQTEPPDLILLDIMMPEMNGYEVCEQLKADEQTCDIPIIFISAMSETADKVKAFSIGGVDYITKPFRTEEVLARVETHLTLRNLQKRLQGQNTQLQQEITERKQAEETLRRRSHQLALINRVSQEFSSTLDLEQVLENILKEIQQLMDIVAVSIWLIEPETGDLVCRVAKGVGSDILFWRLAPGQGITGWVAQSGEGLVVPDTWADERYFKDAERHIKMATRSILSLPLRVTGEVIGVLNFVDTRVGFFTPDDLILLEPIATASAIAIENARLFEEEQKAKEVAETANAALAALNTVAFAVNNSLDLEADLEQALAIVLQEMKLDYGWILLPEDDGRLLRLAVDVGFPDQFHRQESLTPAGRCFCGEVLSKGELRCYFEKDACPRLTSYLEQFPTLATQHISVPVFARQKAVGLLNLGGTNVINLTPNDYEWLKTVAQQIGNAIENATLYQNILGKAERLTTLNRVSTIISVSWQLDQVLPPLLREMARVLEMSLGALVLRSKEGRGRYKVRTHFGRWQSLANLKAIAWHELPLLEIIKQTQAPLLVPRAAGDERLKPLSALIEQENIKTVVMLPLVVQNQLTGFIQMCAIGRERILGAAEVELARTLTNQAAIAIEKAHLYEATVTRYEEELEFARQIQQNLLPRTVPEIPHLRLAGLCQPAYATGGDFYDYIPLPNQCLGIVVGDVTGKSLPAAMVMALARNTVRLELVNHPRPAEAMTTANQWLCQDIRRGTFVAVVEALIDPLNRYMWLVNAGQTAALLARNGQTSYLLPDEASGFPLGIQPNKVYTQAKIPLQSGDTLLFYTDGIVEAKNAAGDMFGFERLEAALQAMPDKEGPDHVINTLMAEMQTFIGEAEQHDDITLVVVQVE